MDLERDIRGTAAREAHAISLYRRVNCPSGCYLTRAQIEGLAEDWAAKVPNRTDPDQLTAFLVSIGGQVLPSDEPDALLIVAERQDRFVVTASDTWGMAEALGHLVLHFPHLEPDTKLDPPRAPVLAVPSLVGALGPLARARHEADWFATAFLMPSEEFRDAWLRARGMLRGAAAILGLPMAMVGARATRLKLA